MATKPVFDDVAPWPEQKAAPAPIGHNMPPIEERIPAEFREALIAEQADFYQKLDDLLGKGDPKSDDYVTGSVDRAKCTDEDQYAKCGVLVNILRKAKQRVEKVHKEQKQPHLDAGRLVDQQRNALVTRFDNAAAFVTELQKSYVREQDRLAEIERQKVLQKEQGLEDDLPSVPEPVLVPETYNPLGLGQPVRTDGATVSAGKEWKSRVDDYAKAFKHVQKDAKVREAIDAAIQRHVKATKGNNGKALAGVHMFEDVRVNNR